MTDQLEFGWDDNSQHVDCPSGQTPPAPFVGKAAASKEKETAQQAKAEALRDYLVRFTALDIVLKVNANRSRVLSIRYDRNGNRAHLNVHQIFVDGPPAIHKALAEWVLHPKRKRAGDTIDAFIREHRAIIHTKKAQVPQLRTAGAHHDLQALYDAVNARFFDNKVDAPITWGKYPSIAPRRSIRFGSYSPDLHLVRIHPYLDSPRVPTYVVQYIVFHEMLHAVMGIEERPSGRRAIHPPAFQAREKAYPDYERATAWIENPKNFRALLKTRNFLGIHHDIW